MTCSRVVSRGAIRSLTVNIFVFAILRRINFVHMLVDAPSLKSAVICWKVLILKYYATESSLTSIIDCRFFVEVFSDQQRISYRLLLIHLYYSITEHTKKNCQSLKWTIKLWKKKHIVESKEALKKQAKKNGSIFCCRSLKCR